jgi:capsular polysaccharide export protein
MPASTAQLIMCQHNRERQLKVAFAKRMVCVPYKFTRVVRHLARNGILWSSLAAAIRSAPDADLEEIAERNLLRRKTRLPRLYGNMITASFYRSLTRFKLRLLRSVVRSHFDANPQANGLVFNGYLAPSALVELEARSRYRKVLYLEKGYFPNTIQCDCGGINADAQLPKSADFYRSVADRIPSDLPQLIERRVNKKAGAQVTDLPQHFVFVPFQVPSDMQILKHSPWVRDMPGFHDLLLQLTERCDLTFVVKEHPSFPISIKDKVRKHPRIIFANNNDTADLIARSKAVLTINSTVGLEALSRNKPVVSLGKAIYNIPEIVRHARTMDELVAALLTLGEWRPEETVRDAFLRYVFNVFLLHGSFDDLNPALIQKLIDRLNGVDLHSTLLHEHAVAV